MYKTDVCISIRVIFYDCDSTIYVFFIPSKMDSGKSLNVPIPSRFFFIKQTKATGLGFVHSKRMESGSVSDFDRLAFGLLVQTFFITYLIELCLIGNFLLATPLPQAKIA